jgi:hypothetical protein
MQPIENKLSYKKLIGFTPDQKKSFEKLEQYGVNVNQFIRSAIREKIQREWKQIKQRAECPF